MENLKVVRQLRDICADSQNKATIVRVSRSLKTPGGFSPGVFLLMLYMLDN